MLCKDVLHLECAHVHYSARCAWHLVSHDRVSSVCSRISIQFLCECDFRVPGFAAVYLCDWREGSKVTHCTREYVWRCLRCSKRNSAAKADAVTLGDAWLAPAISRGLIQPIPDPADSAWWVRGLAQPLPAKI